MADGRQPWVIIAFLGGIYCFSGGIEAVPLALTLHCLVTSTSALFAYRAARRLGAPHQAAMISGWIIALSPAFAIWSSALYKEGFILIVLFLIVEHTLLLQQDLRLSSLLILPAGLLGMFGLRFYMGALLTVITLVGLLLVRPGRSDRRSGVPTLVRQAVILVSILGVFFGLGISDQTQKLVSADMETNLKVISESRRDLASYNSGYLPEADVSTLDGASRFLPVGLAYFLTVPLPWHIGSLRQNITIPEVAVWILFFYPMALKGAHRAVQRNPQGFLFVLLASLAICFFYALFSGNIGTTYRMRIQVWALWALFVGWGLYNPSGPPLQRMPLLFLRSRRRARGW